MATELVSGDFAVRFGWSEGNDDTGVLIETVRHFAADLVEYLSKNGAWSINVYGPDGERVSAAGDDNELCASCVDNDSDGPDGYCSTCRVDAVTHSPISG